MISKSQISFIKSLHQKKFRNEHHLFIAEGLKTVTEFVGSGYAVDTIFHTGTVIPKLVNLSHKIKLIEISPAELDKISTLNTPQGLLALVVVPPQPPLFPPDRSGGWTLVLDGIQDPGNLGTIIRTADWFGFTQIVCSEDTVEAYNPKVVQATMGSLAHITVQYTDLPRWLNNVEVPVYGTLLDGTSIYSTDFPGEGLLVLGNEGKGISAEVLRHVTRKITIPRFGKAESLNVSMAAGIICSEIMRGKSQ